MRSGVRPLSIMSQRITRMRMTIMTSAIWAVRRRLSRSSRMPRMTNMADKTVMSTASETKMTRAAADSSSTMAPCCRAITMPTMSSASTGTSAAPLTMHRMPNTLSGRGILLLDAGAPSSRSSPFSTRSCLPMAMFSSSALLSVASKYSRRAGASRGDYDEGRGSSGATSSTNQRGPS